MKFTIQELIDAAQTANEKANAAFTAIGILRWHFDDKEVVEVLRQKGVRKGAQAERFEARYMARLKALEDEVESLRELLAPMAWQDKPSGEGKYVRMPFPHLPYIVSFVDVWDYGDMVLANGEGDNARPVEDLGGLWLKLPDVPSGEAA